LLRCSGALSSDHHPTTHNAKTLPLLGLQMTRGVPISKEMRIQIYHWLITLGRSPQETKDANICLREVSIRRLVCLSFYLRRNSFRLAYLDGPQWKSGRKRILSCEALEIIKDMACAKKKFILSNLKSEFDLFYFNQLALYPDQSGSRTTFFRAMQRGGISRKVMERRHMFCDDVKGLEYVEFMALYDPSLVVDIDEMKQAPEDFLCKYGWSPIGEECIKQKILIGTRSFCVIAAYTPDGFLCWETYEMNVTAFEFNHFLETRVAPLLAPDNFLILDNAATHHTDEVRIVLQQITHGNYRFSPPYSPHLKPIEKGFALIKAYIKQNEDEALLRPVAFINQAFALHGIGGARASSAKGHWSGYFGAREVFLNDE